MIITPEMSGKILDESHFKFHVECKAKIINAFNKLKKGADFLKSLSKLEFSTDKRWTQNSCNDPNVRALLDILEDYKKVEHRPSRLKLLVPILEYAIGLYASDLFYRERGEWFILQILERSNQFRFSEQFTKPINWYPIRRNDGAPLNADINQEYKDWYGVDPTDDNCVISYDITQKNELIKAQREWVEQHCNTTWAQLELEKIE